EKRWGSGDLEAALEGFVPRPSLGSFPRGTPSSHADVTRAGLTSGERRERRGVVALDGLPRAGVLGPRARAVLEDIAFKADAVVRFPDEGGVRFQMLFGLGRASVTDPLKALAAATDCLDALRGLSVDRGEAVEASVGVGRGVVSTVRDGRGRLLRWVPVDAVLGVSAALAEAGAPGEVLAAGEVHRLARRDYAFAPAREVEVFRAAGATTRSVAAWPLTRALRGHEKVAEGDRGAVVGREVERAQLEALYAEVRETGRAQFVTVVGELGAGKTALVEAALEGLAPAARVLRAECTFGARDVPFEAVTELLRSGLGGGDAPETMEATLRTAARRLLGPAAGEQVARDLAPLVGGTSRRPEEGDADRERLVARAMERWMAGLARAARSAHDGALVTWVDGLQWADAPSLALLARMSRRSYDAPCLIVLGTRPDPAVLAALRAVPRLELGPLPDAARTALLTRHLGAAPAPELRQALVRRGGGNPFFLLELADAMKERGAIEVEETPGGRIVRRRSGAPLQLPTTLEGVVAERLDELEAP
ncbi:MAG: AAA family ATPase, partial [Myxococcota bacterium]